MSAFASATSTNTAVVFIEFQNEFCSSGGKLNEAVQPCIDAKDTLGNAARLLEACRSKGIKVIHCPITFSDDYRELSPTPYGILGNVKAGGAFKASGWGGAIIDTMKPHDSEVIVAGKRGLCGFASTNLDFILRHNNITHVALAGFLTNCCVESTMRAAYEKGYSVTTLVDCCAATSVEEHDAATKFTFPMFSKPTESTTFLAAFP